MTLGDRQKFVIFLAERFGLDSAAVWKSMIGNGSTSGLLHQALYHSSPAGVAFHASQPVPKQKVHLPESKHQLAWLRTWQDLRTKKGAHADARRLIEIYLASLSGTGTVERFIKCKGELSHRRGGLHVRSLETSLKLLVQDEGGRRREALGSGEAFGERAKQDCWWRDGCLSSKQLFASSSSQVCRLVWEP